ncbi:MAG: succinate--CoA ligase subunit alpha [bacterium]
MSILVNRHTKVIVQGITGREGSFHTAQMIAYGTDVAAGVTPGKGGTRVNGVPVFNSMEEAVAETNADTSIIFVPSQFAVDAVYEAAFSGIRLIICISEGLPALEMMLAKKRLTEMGVRIIGPNCPGIITPGECKIGIMPSDIHRPGRIGIISRSGTLTYEVVAQVTALGLGQSTAIGIGGDPITGMSFVDCLGLFQDDPGTDAVIMIGEIGGQAEEKAADFVASTMTKPVIGFVAGKTAPPEKRMGHAGAIISGGKGTAEDKIGKMRDAGIIVVDSLGNIGKMLLKYLDQ